MFARVSLALYLTRIHLAMKPFASQMHMIQQPVIKTKFIAWHLLHDH